MKSTRAHEMKVFTGVSPDPVVAKAAEVLAREIERRTGSRPAVAEEGPAEPTDVVLDVTDAISPEGFSIRTAPDAPARVLGGDARGVLYGCGRLLRAARFAENSIVLGPSEGPSAPESDMRAVYFATHFGNYYHAAPVEEVARYVEELALWGVNALILWFDMHHYTSIDDPKALEHIDRLRHLFRTARSVGMRVGLITLANEAYSASPEDLRADPDTGRAHYRVELCPSKPGAIDVILAGLFEEFDRFEHLDIVWIWPYDQGGCACEKCRPWGANGFLKAARAISARLRQTRPDVKIILSTWLFDRREDQGEWRGLYRALERDAGWIDGVLADNSNDFPAWPLEHPLPGGLPLYNFPEISMQGMYPWGGFGANPRPRHWQRIREKLRGRIQGGFPYSEGIYEDVNKIIWAQGFWDGSRPTAEILREYAAYEFSPGHADEICEAMTRMEDTLDRYGLKIANLDGATEIWDTIKRVDAELPAWAKSAWRWRLVYLRALIDAELKANDLEPNDAVREAVREISDIYCASQAENHVKPHLDFAEPAGTGAKDKDDKHPH